MFPSLDDYRAHPTPEAWTAAKHDVDLVSHRTAIAISAVLLYDASLEPELGLDLHALHRKEGKGWAGMTKSS
jgi:hypothetical protein